MFVFSLFDFDFFRLWRARPGAARDRQNRLRAAPTPPPVCRDAPASIFVFSIFMFVFFRFGESEHQIGLDTPNAARDGRGRSDSSAPVSRPGRWRRGRWTDPWRPALPMAMRQAETRRREPPARAQGVTSEPVAATRSTRLARDGRASAVWALPALAGPFGTLDSLTLTGRPRYWGAVVLAAYANGTTVGIARQAQAGFTLVPRGGFRAARA
jgi:hypothetical protein